MPRISRTDVQWDADGHTWVARFTHRHNEKGEIMGREPIPVKHLTTCTLSWKKNGSVSTVGESRCSLKDKYNWRIGIKRSLVRALENAGISVEHDKKRFGEIVREFYLALRVKDYWPHNGIEPVKSMALVRTRSLPVIDGFVIPKEYTGKMHGLGWSGD